MLLRVDADTAIGYAGCISTIGNDFGEYMIHIIGTISLNLSMVLYMIFYFPQLLHNKRAHQLNDLSLGLHALLFISTAADLYYGFGRIDQWQYRLVSVILFLCLLIQHVQLVVVYRHCWEKLRSLLILSAAVVIILLGLIYALYALPSHHALYVAMGWVERVGYCLYALPQLMKGRQAAGSVSMMFVSMGIVTALLDTTSAWIFDWGSPSLYGGILVAFLQSVLLWQCLSITRWGLCRDNKAYG
jgi:hypothetical protein